MKVDAPASILMNTESAVKTLMKESHWARDQTIASLSRSLKAELDEFITSFELGDRVNVFSEAGDVLMILMCCLMHQIDNSTDPVLSKILHEMQAKLHRRFSHLYKSGENSNIRKQLSLFEAQLPETNGRGLSTSTISRETEDAIWEKSKRKENIQNYAFCVNSLCKKRNHVGLGNMVVVSKTKLKCIECDANGTITDNTLFSNRRTSRERILSTIARVIRDPTQTGVQFSQLDSGKKRNVRAWMLASLSHEKALKNALERRYGILPDETEDLLDSVLRDIRLPVISSHSKSSKYHARSWDYQDANRHILRSFSGKNIEAMTIKHFRNSELRDVTIEVSNMFGCTVGCYFCAANALGHASPLNPIEYLAQVNSCLTVDGITPDELPEFQVSFAGIGEPSVVAQKILYGAAHIYRLYPSVRFNIATSGYNLLAFDTWRASFFHLRTIQLPYYHHNPELMKHVFSKTVPPPIHYVLPKALLLAGANEHCRVKINYILIKGLNDDSRTLDEFMGLVDAYRDSIAIKLSFLNPTEATSDLSLLSPEMAKFERIRAEMQGRGFQCYVFGTPGDPQIGCGQLAAQSFCKQGNHLE